MNNTRKRVDDRPKDGAIEPKRVVKGDFFQEVVCDWLASDKNALVPSTQTETASQLLDTAAAQSQEITLAEVAAQLYQERRLRDACFKEVDIFGEPAWDILLDVAFAEAKGERLSISKVCIGSCVPVSTALRWINILHSRDLVYKVGDTGDPLETFVRLTEQGHEKTKKYLASVRSLRGASSAP